MREGLSEKRRNQSSVPEVTAPGNNPDFTGPPATAPLFTHCLPSPTPEVASRHLGCAGVRGGQTLQTHSRCQSAALQILCDLRCAEGISQHSSTYIRQMYSGTTESPICHESSRGSLVTASMQASITTKIVHTPAAAPGALILIIFLPCLF